MSAYYVNTVGGRLLKPLPTSSAFDHPNIVILSRRRGILGLLVLTSLQERYKDARAGEDPHVIATILQPFSTRLKHLLHSRASARSGFPLSDFSCSLPSSSFCLFVSYCWSREDESYRFR